ncbi:MAG: cytidylate kinase-like family protein [Bacteroidales bacterium]|nr:cytidylate kinase-like family protein [Bacteroidales bacterium]
MNNSHVIINIGRQAGSGGVEIGKLLAQKMQIKFYDKALIKLAAKESGLDSTYFEKADEKPSSNFFYALTHNLFGFNNETVLSNNALFQMQSDVIRKLASENSCVIVGRTSDYILRDFKNCINIFIHAPLESRVATIIKNKGISEHQARHLINTMDKKRANYYNYYTNKQWGYAESYHLGLDSSVWGTEGSVEFIKLFVEQKLKLSIV